MKHRYNYNSYTSKPNVILSIPIISVESLKTSFQSQLKESTEDKNVTYANFTIENYADYLIKEKEKNRGYNYSSVEKRKLKKQIVKDIKNRKIKIKL